MRLSVVSLGYVLKSMHPIGYLQCEMLETSFIIVNSSWLKHHTNSTVQYGVTSHI